MITFNPSHAQPFQKLRVSCKNLLLYTFVLLSVVSTWTCHCHTCFSVKPTMQANRVPKNSVTYKLHKQRAYIYITHHHAVEIVYVPHWQQLAKHIVFFSCYAMQMFSIQYGKNVERECWKKINLVSLWPAQSRQNIYLRICLHAAVAGSRSSIKWNGTIANTYANTFFPMTNYLIFLTNCLTDIIGWRY